MQINCGKTTGTNASPQKSMEAHFQLHHEYIEEGRNDKWIQLSFRHSLPHSQCNAKCVCTTSSPLSSADLDVLFILFPSRAHERDTPCTLRAYLWNAKAGVIVRSSLCSRSSCVSPASSTSHRASFEFFLAAASTFFAYFVAAI